MVPGYVYDLFIMADQRCQMEENIYDVFAHCYDNDCSLEKIIENEESAIFQIIGVLNSLAAAYYQDMQDIPEEHLRDAYFDMYQEIGRNLGTLMRKSFRYDVGGYHTYYWVNLIITFSNKNNQNFTKPSILKSVYTVIKICSIYQINRMRIMSWDKKAFKINLM